MTIKLTMITAITFFLFSLPSGDPNFSTLWKQVEALENEGQYQTALEKVREIKLLAENVSNKEQVLKALLYEAKYTGLLGENDLNLVIDQLEDFLAQTTDPVQRAVLQSYLGDLYRSRVNRSNSKLEREALQNQAHEHFVASIENMDALGGHSKYLELITNPENPKVKGFELMDILVRRALDFLVEEQIRTYMDVPDHYTLRPEEFVNQPELDGSSDLNDAVRRYERYLLSKNDSELLAEQYLWRLSHIQHPSEKTFSNNILSFYHSSSDAIKVRILHQFHPYFLEAYSKIKQLYKSKLPDYENQLAISILEQFEQPQTTLQMEDAYIDGAPLIALLKTNQIKHIDVEIRKISPSDYLKLSYYRNRSSKSIGNKVYNEQFEIKKDGKLNMTFPSLGLGQYMLSIRSRTADSLTLNVKVEDHYTFFQVSNIALVQYHDHLHTLNGESGESLSRVALEYINFKGNRNDTQRVVRRSESDDDGQIALMDESRSNYTWSVGIIARHGKDVLVKLRSYHDRNSSNYKEFLSARIFTDRSIYHLGDEVMFSGVVLKQDNKTGISRVHFGLKEVKAILYNQQRQKLSESTLKIDEYGGFQGAFDLPKTSLLGMMSIVIEDSNRQLSSQMIRLEEYKAPRYTVGLELAERSEDVIKVKGNCQALAGYPISDAEVEYTVRLKTVLWRGYDVYYNYGRQKEKIVKVGKVKTDEQGMFVLSWAREKIEDAPGLQYEVSVKVIDQNGEVRQETMSIPYSEALLRVEWNGLSKRMNLEEMENLEVKFFNYRDEEVQRKAIWKLYKIDGKAKNRVKLLWDTEASLPFLGDSQQEKRAKAYYYFPDPEKKGAISQTGTLNSEDPVLDLKQMVKMPGAYRIEVVLDDQTFNYEWDVQSVPKGASPISNPLIYSCDSSFDEEKHPLKIELNSQWSEKLRVFYGIYQNRELLKQEWINIRSFTEIDIPFEERFRGNIELVFSYTWKGRTHHINHHIEVPYDNKQLKAEWLDWPSEIETGASREIKLRLTDHLNNPVQTQVSLSIYNKGLDEIVDHQWRTAYYPNYQSTLRFSSTCQDMSSQTGGYWNYDPRNSNYYELPHLIPVFNVPHHYAYAAYDQVMLSRSMKKGKMDVSEEMESANFAGGEEVMVTDADAAVKESSPPSAQKDEVRTELEDYLYFKGDLRSDENGIVRIPVEMNDKISSWSLIVHAHSHDLKFYADKRELKSFKHLILAPNVPRFLHETDDIKLTSKLINLSGKKLSVKLGARFYNEQTQDWTELDILGERQRMVADGKTISYTVEFKVPEGLEQLRLQFYAESEGYQDVIEEVLPIRRNQVSLVESIPIMSFNDNTVWDKEALERLLNQKNIEIENIALEYSADYRIPLLIALAQVFDQSEFSATDVYYKWLSFKMVEEIVRQDPSIKTVFERMKRDRVPLNPLSDLGEMRIMETKNTTWSKEGAKEESLLYQHLDQLLNPGIRNAETSRLWNKFRQFVNSDGGIKWCLSSPRSSFRTSLILAESLARLLRNDVIEAEERNLLVGLTHYISEEFATDLSKLKNFKTVYRHEIVSYALLLMSLEESTEKQWWSPDTEMRWIKDNFMKLSNGFQARLGIYLHKKGDPEITKLHQSLMERSFYDPKVGRFWNSQNGWQWSEWKLSNHSYLIEFFSLMGGDNQVLKETKQWLISHKQGNTWKNPSDIGDAVFSLLLPPSHKGEARVGLRMSGEDLMKDYPYVYKDNISPDQILSLAIDPSSHGYGAIFIRYDVPTQAFEKESQELPLDLKIKYSKVSKEGLVPIRESELQVGDLVHVELTLEVDRPMDYVALINKRISGSEPTEVLSRYYWSPVPYYSANYADHQAFFIEHLSRGTHQFEYEFYVEQAGKMSSGISQVQSIYAPEFVNNAENILFDIDKNK